MYVLLQYVHSLSMCQFEVSVCVRRCDRRKGMVCVCFSILCVYECILQSSVSFRSIFFIVMCSEMYECICEEQRDAALGLIVRPCGFQKKGLFMVFVQKKMCMRCHETRLTNMPTEYRFRLESSRQFLLV